MKIPGKCGHIVNDVYPECVSVTIKTISDATRTEIQENITLCVVCGALLLKIINEMESAHSPVQGVVAIPIRK